ncbi:MAG TPA: hypothetical protein PKI11_03575 [Candidatus Hydrogenedentes bacterium]|nr:hypothetical protein [Candidatus Hydrogenedentota bacterium]
MRKRWVIAMIIAAVLAAVLVAGGLYGLHRVRRPHAPYPASLKVARDFQRSGVGRMGPAPLGRAWPSIHWGMCGMTPSKPRCGASAASLKANRARMCC